MTRRLAMIFGLAFAVALAATLPLKLVLDWGEPSDLGASVVSGSVWNGRIENAVFRGTPLGTLQARLDPVAVLTGVARVRLEAERGRANVLNGRRRGFENATVALDTKELGLPLPGTMRLEDASVVFSGDACVEATGNIRTSVARQSYGGPELEGSLACAGKDAVARLEGASDGYAVAMTVNIQPNGHYRAETVVTGADAEQQSALALAGFSSNGDVLQRVDDGRLMF